MLNQKIKKIYFSKMHGLGNDFVIIEKIHQDFEISESMIKKLSNRNTGIGFDQLLIIEQSFSPEFDFYYRIFNANGIEVSQCGNGARCFAYFVYLKKLTKKKKLIIKTHTNNINIEIFDKNKIIVNMGQPIFYPHQIPMLFPKKLKQYCTIIDDNKIQFGAVSVGNPHCVIIVNNLNTYPVNEIGSLMSKNVLFPHQINVNFMQIINVNHIFLRVYERGVGETQACGSGACASVVIGIIQNVLKSEVTVTLPGGNLYIQWYGDGYPVYMTGPADHVYDGYFYL